MTKTTDDVRIQNLKQLIAPATLIQDLPITDSVKKTVLDARQAASDVIHGRDDRLLIVVGPCSIHDIDAAMEYAHWLKQEAVRYQDDLLIFMRVYFEKPRTSIGWKGLINDPHLDNTFDINHGLRMARELVLQIGAVGLPVAGEFLDTITPQYLCDLFSWGAIGARTTESQVHRELASGLSMPVGFKNGTDGNVRIAIDAVKAANHSHHFLSVTKQGQTAIVNTLGNADCHIILRGSTKGTNYDEKSIIKAAKMLDREKRNHRLMVDCSHGNSQKDYTRQKLAARCVAQQIASGSTLVMGIMLESYLHEGNQPLIPGKELKYGVSVTDACIGKEETGQIFSELSSAIQARRQLSNDSDALSQYRNKIDEIDKTIETLITERAIQAKEIAAIKKAVQGSTTLYRPEREKAVLRKILERNKGPISDQHMEDIFRQIMTACLEVEK